MNKRIRKKKLLKKPSNREKVKFWMKAYDKAKQQHDMERDRLLSRLSKAGINLVREQSLVQVLANENLDLRRQLADAKKPFWKKVLRR